MHGHVGACRLRTILDLSLVLPIELTLDKVTRYLSGGLCG
jgi:hypothetical protein